MEEHKKGQNREFMRGVSLCLLLLCISACLLITDANGRTENTVLWYIMNITGSIAFPLFISWEGYRYASDFSFSQKSMKVLVLRFIDYLFFYALISAVFFLVKLKQPALFPVGTPVEYGEIIFRSLSGVFLLYLTILYMLLFAPFMIVLRLISDKLKTKKIVVPALLTLLFVFSLVVGLWVDHRFADLEVCSFEYVKLARFSVFFILGVVLSFDNSFFFGLFGKITAIVSGLIGIILFCVYHKTAGFTPVFRLPVYGLLIMLFLWPLMPILLRNVLQKSRVFTVVGRWGTLFFLLLSPILSICSRLSNAVSRGNVWISFLFLSLFVFILLFALVSFLDRYYLFRIPTRKKVYVAIGRSLPSFFFLVALLLLLAAIWLVTSWGDLTIDEVIFHIVAPAEGTAKSVINGFILKCAVPFGIALIILCLFQVRIRHTKKFRKWVNIILSLAVPILLFGCLTLLDRKMDLVSYLRSQFVKEDFIKDHYTDPNDVNITFPEKKRNIIFIFLESMETTFADEENGGAFPDNLIPGLTELAEEGINFSGSEGGLNGGYVTSGTGFTAGAMFAMTSGLPLKVDMFRNDMDTQTNFFPNITCVGDITLQNGYRNELLVGSHATFGGRKLMYNNHGVSEIRDLDYYRENGKLPPDYNVWWGYEDEKLFQFAKEELLALSESDEPFMFSMLTVDTHFEDGYTCELCGNEFGDNKYANVYACSDRQVTAFVEWLREQDFYENTTIVISGDHTTMDKDFCDGVDPSYDRRFYLTILNSVAGEEPIEKRTFTAMDIYPTTLAAAGVQIDGNRLGLGVNLFSEEKTLPEELGIDTFQNKMMQKSGFLQEYGAIEITDEYCEAVQKEAIVKLTDHQKDEFLGVDKLHFKIRLKYRYETIPGTNGFYLDCWQEGKHVGRARMTFDHAEDLYQYYSVDLLVPECEFREDQELTIRIMYDSEQGNFEFYASDIRNLKLYFAELNDLLKMARDDRYILFLAVKNDAMAGMHDDTKQVLYDIGVQANLDDLYRKGFCIVMYGDDVREEIAKDKTETVSISGSIDDGKVEYEMLSSGKEAENMVKIIVNGVDYGSDLRGLHMVIYDKERERVIYAATADTHVYDNQYLNRERIDPE